MDEDQFVLRLPEPLVELMRFALSSTKKRDAAGDDKKASSFVVDFRDERNAVFKVDGKEYPASLMDLPCIMETHKTADKRTFYKSGDVHQVLVVRMPDEPAPTSHVLMDGLTPAAKGAGKRLAAPAPVFSSEQVESVEHRVKYVIDHKVKFVAKKDEPAAPPDDEELVIEEETAEQPPASKPDDATAKPAEAATKPVETPAEPSAVPATPVANENSDATPDARLGSDVQPSPSAGTPMPEGDDDEEEDDDDFAEMAGELMEDDEEEEAKKRIERANLDQKIVSQEAKISEIEERAAKAPNAVLRQRILAKRGGMQAELAKLQSARAELGEGS